MKQTIWIGLILATGLVVADWGRTSSAQGTPAARATTHPQKPASTSSSSSSVVRVVIPNGHNLQWMNFWVAQGSGLLSEEGIEVKITFSKGTQLLLEGMADVGILPAPKALTLIEQRQPILIVASLFWHDPVNLVVQPKVAQSRGLSLDQPLAERLRGLRGLSVGVANGPASRLRALFASAGLDADRDIEMVVLPGAAQNAAFASHAVDALYAHTPYLETALVDQGAVLIVNQSAGKVPQVAYVLNHMLATTPAYANANADVLVRLIRALYRAQQLIHTDHMAAVTALRRSNVKLKAPQGLETIVSLYEPAIPQTPLVSTGELLRRLALFSASRTPPNLTGVDLTTYVDNQFAFKAIASSP